ncbi:MAG: right-handed parallel beta-helix repeat-containing protein [Elainellaceae cyanobacterium]
MKSIAFASIFSITTSLAIGGPAIAQTAPGGTPAPATSASLLISPRLSVGHTTSGAGFDGTTEFGGFVPLQQEEGRNITFFEPQFLLDNDGQVGGNLLIGHRAYSRRDDRIWGGYVSLDNRQPEEDDFYQIGLGLETIGRVIDARINGYIPIGDTSHVIDEDTFTSTSTSSGFEGNLLVLSSTITDRTRRVEEFALGGFDAEVGAKLLEWNEGDGDLRGFAGFYFYDSDDVDSSLGYRVGLEVRPVNQIVLGVSVQEDDIFGTNVVGSFSLSFPRVRPKQPIAEEDQVVARLGEPTRRNSSIAVETQESFEDNSESFEMPLMNPEEEEAYRFVHVTLGATGGDGTFEAPFGTVEDAIADTISDGNNIVYVDAGSNPDIPAFTIPDRVRVLSQGPTQTLAGLPFPGFPEDPSRLPFSPDINFEDGILVELPLSGDGNFPLIQEAGAANLVTLQNSAVLSGFVINGATEGAVVATGVENAEIRDNFITNSGQGIALTDVSGSVILFDNAISDTTGGAGSGQGIAITNTLSDSIEVSIARQDITGTRVGIDITANGDLAAAQDPQQIVTINDTGIADSDEEGLRIEASDLGNQAVSFTGGTIDGSGSDGVLVLATSIGSQEVTIEESDITNSGGNGISVVGGTPDGLSTAAQEVFINDNTIADSAGAGISIVGSEVVAQEFAIGGNVITGNDGGGIVAIAQNLAFQEYVTDAANDSLGISNNLISGNGGQAISLSGFDSATVIADIQGNVSEDNDAAGAPDVEVTANANTNDVCVFLDGNTTASSIQLNNNSAVPAFFEVVNLPGVSALNSSGVTFSPSEAAFTNVAGVMSCFGALDN